MGSLLKIVTGVICVYASVVEAGPLPTATVGCPVCDGRFCELPGSQGGTCLIGDNACVCVAEARTPLATLTPPATNTPACVPSPTVGCGGPCNGQFCELPDATGGNCLVGIGGCVCVPELRTPPPVRTPCAASCAGDCDGNRAVTVDEIITAVQIALGENELLGCASSDLNRDGEVTVDEILGSIDIALEGCPHA